ncbi:13237_t:CDS:2, partial [Entrophospora sp. SA101]
MVPMVPMFNSSDFPTGTGNSQHCSRQVEDDNNSGAACSLPLNMQTHFENRIIDTYERALKR